MSAPANTIKWGILGTGAIANAFVKGLQHAPDAELLAVGSRAQETADAFASAYDIPRRYSSYRRLAEDPDVDVIYISTPHTLHCENTLLCLRSGKHVLCEKPFAINAQQAEFMVQCAREQNLFLMEAMWTRFIPAVCEIRRLLQDKHIGELQMFMGHFGFQAPFDPESRLFNPALGGGALLDVGIYPVSFSSMILGEPEGITGFAHLGTTGVDEQAAVLLKHPGDRIAVISCAISTDLPEDARIIGTGGTIIIPERCWRPDRFIVTHAGQEDEIHSLPVEGNGYNYQAEEVHRCLRKEQKESEVMPLEETCSIMHTLDVIRLQWGLKYPGETT
jgi:predicted dehydrogenase